MKRLYKNKPLTVFSRMVMVMIDAFVFVSAIGGGYALIFSNGAGMPVSYLSGTVFTSFLLPGLILVFVVGGSHLLALLTLKKKNRYWMEGTAVAGFGLLIWIFTEMYIIKETHFLQILFFTLAVINLSLLLFLMEGKRQA